MKMIFNNWRARTRALAMAAAAALVSCSSVSQAEPDYDIIGKQFSLVLQNAHFSRARFSQDMYQKFLDCYVQSLDAQHLFLTQQDVEYLRKRYASSFGDYLLANQTTRLAEELYAYFSARALPRIALAEKLLQEYSRAMPSFDSDRSVPRSRRKLPRAENAAELDQLWRDQVRI
ncbi:MAG: hypothetical protein IIV41_00840 [Akkermansia sp.]|nr:hypothetical protein [Akkermansia sp.]